MFYAILVLFHGYNVFCYLPGDTSVNALMFPLIPYIVLLSQRLFSSISLYGSLLILGALLKGWPLDIHKNKALPWKLCLPDESYTSAGNGGKDSPVCTYSGSRDEAFSSVVPSQALQ